MIKQLYTHLILLYYCCFISYTPTLPAFWPYKDQFTSSFAFDISYSLTWCIVQIPTEAAYNTSSIPLREHLKTLECCQSPRKKKDAVKDKKRYKVIKKLVNAGLWQRLVDVIKRNAEEDGSGGVGVRRLTNSGNVPNWFNPQLSARQASYRGVQHPEPTTTPRNLKTTPRCPHHWCP